MAIVEGGDIGFDEGAIFASLQDPVYTKTVVKYRHNKDGLVTSETTTVYNLTGTMVLTMVAGGAVLKILNDLAGIIPDPEETGEAMGKGFGNWWAWFKGVSGAGWVGGHD